MKLNEKTYSWKGVLKKRKKTDYIIIHHAAAASMSADDIHRVHIKKGWTGIGYHFYIRKDGNVYYGRPIDTVGAHCENYNSVSIGVCFEGNFENDSMNSIQKNAGNKLLTYLKKVYPNAQIKRHKDFNATLCPGKNLPFNEISNSLCELTENSDIIDSLYLRGIMTDKKLWLEKCTSDKNTYWLARKIANKTKNCCERQKKLESVNDIVWELGHRKIITDTSLWLKLFESDKNLYWLGYKAVNMTD